MCGAHIGALGRTAGCLDNAVLCAERAIGGDPFAVLLADDFLTDYEPDMNADLAQTFAISSKAQLSVIEINGSDISKYCVVVLNDFVMDILGLLEKPDGHDAPSNLASIGRYILTLDIYDTCKGLGAKSSRRMELISMCSRALPKLSV